MTKEQTAAVARLAQQYRDLWKQANDLLYKADNAALDDQLVPALLLTDAGLERLTVARCALADAVTMQVCAGQLEIEGRAA
jgi:hypothetical protein